MTTNAVLAQVAAKWQESFVRINRNQPGITGLLAQSEAWERANAYLYPQDIDQCSPKTPQEYLSVRPAFESLSASKLLPTLLEKFLEDVRERQYLITADINRYLGGATEEHLPYAIAQLLERLVEWYEEWIPPPDLGPSVNSIFTTAFQTHIFSALPRSFTAGLATLIRWTMSPPPETLTVVPPTITDGTIWTHFETLGLVDRYESVLTGTCYAHIEQHVRASCAGEFAQPMLVPLRSWMADNILPWMVHPFAQTARTQEEARLMLQGIGSRFDFHLCKTLCDLRLSEIFDIIVDYPDSDGALKDLQECINRTDQRTELVRALRAANKKRLLHPGANTRVILQQYVFTIRCLRQIDPPGVLLHKVADPIRRYLRERPDTIRCIVASLVADDELGDSVVDANEPIQPLQAPQAEDYSDQNWEPEPIDAGPDFRSNRPADIVSTLVSIYDSRDLFVKELQVLLAQRLLAVTNGNFDRERRYIEILKIRFGEAALQVCEVMLRDMDDSRRTDQHIQTRDPSSLHPTIISEHFWPSLQTSQVTLPGQFKQIQEAYAKEYSIFKPDKRLRWLPLLGTVSVELELQDRSIAADVPPLAAMFIELFSEQPSWTVDALVARIGVKDKPSATKALGTWIELGVLRLADAHAGLYELLEVAETGRKNKTSARQAAPIVLLEQPEIEAAQQQQMMVHWKYIEGMLKNLGAQPLDRIQSTLKIVPGYDRTPEHLAAFMDAARREGLVSFTDGKYKLEAPQT